jgi:hypothetical protein
MLAILNRAYYPVELVYEDGIYIATMRLERHG